MPITPTAKIWMNGQLVDWDDANVHILTHSLHYGMGVFEGVRAYETPDGPAVFRLTEHMERLHDSARIMMMDLPYSVEELVEATKAVVVASGLAVVLHPPHRLLRLRRDGPQHPALLGRRVHRLLAVGRVPGRGGGDQGRAHEDLVVAPPRPQHHAAGGQDHRQLRELVAGQGRGPQGRLRRGHHVELGRVRVSECTGENIFAARHGVLITPPLAAGALEGITQSSVMTIARDLGFETRMDHLTRSDLYICEEMFVCGTAAEVSAVNSVDDRPIPTPGPMTSAIAAEYAKAVRGQVDRYKDWLEHVR